jgi:hypothetical protein
MFFFFSCWFSRVDVVDVHRAGRDQAPLGACLHVGVILGLGAFPSTVQQPSTPRQCAAAPDVTQGRGSSPCWRAQCESVRLTNQSAALVVPGMGLLRFVPVPQDRTLEVLCDAVMRRRNSRSYWVGELLHTCEPVLPAV